MLIPLISRICYLWAVTHGNRPVNSTQVRRFFLKENKYQWTCKRTRRKRKKRTDEKQNKTKNVYLSSHQVVFFKLPHLCAKQNCLSIRLKNAKNKWMRISHYSQTAGLKSQNATCERTWPFLVNLTRFGCGQRPIKWTHRKWSTGEKTVVFGVSNSSKRFKPDEENKQLKITLQANSKHCDHQPTHSHYLGLVLHRNVLSRNSMATAEYSYMTFPYSVPSFNANLHLLVLMEGWLSLDQGLFLCVNVLGRN